MSLKTEYDLQPLDDGGNDRTSENNLFHEKITAPHVYHTFLNLKSNARLRRETVPKTTFFFGGREFIRDDEFSLIPSLLRKKHSGTVSLRI